MAVARADDGREMSARGCAEDADAARIVAAARSLRTQEADRGFDLVDLAREPRLRRGAEVETRDGKATLDQRRERHRGFVAVLPRATMEPDEERRAGRLWHVQVEQQRRTGAVGEVGDIGLNGRSAGGRFGPTAGRGKRKHGNWH